MKRILWFIVVASMFDSAHADLVTPSGQEVAAMTSNAPSSAVQGTSVGDVTYDRLEGIYKRYQIAKQDRPEQRVKILIDLDQELRLLIDAPWLVQNKMIDQKYWEKKYLDIGVGVSGALNYSGKLLTEAKTLDVNSKYASYTRYADVSSGRGSFTSAFKLPNIEAALAYEKEFPNGPFIWDALVITGNFYSDLNLLLRQSASKNYEKDYKYDCYSKYINEKSIAEQIENARILAVKFYKKALAIQSDYKAANNSIQEWTKELESNDEDLGWHYCGD